MKTQTILVLVLIATCCTLARAQPTGQVDRAMETPPYDFGEEIDRGLSELGLPEGVFFEDLDESTRKKYMELIDKCFQYHISSYQHREKVFAWQHCSSQIIFAVVIILVFTAIYFSWLQFRQSLEPRHTKAAKQARQSKAAVKEIEAIQLEVTAKGIKVKSSVLGVVILVISLLFFYLYLVHVYKITEIQ